MKQPDDTFTLNAEQGEALIERLKRKSITEEDYALLIKVVNGYFWLILSLREAKMSMHRFKAMIFGEKKRKKPKHKDTDQASSPKDDDDPPPLAGEDNTATQDDNAVDDDKPSAAAGDGSARDKAPPKGHGRMGAAAYTGATVVAVPHTAYTAGMPCPIGQGECGTLHAYPSGVTITVSGFAPLQATRYDIEKLQCSACRTIFSAPLPSPLVEAKGRYTAEAKATLAVMHYAMAVPFNRLERLQQMMGVPVPDSTQWDLVEQLANHVYPVYDHLVYLAAQSWLIYQDDTWVRILSLMKENAHAAEGDRKGLYSTGLVTQTGERSIVLFFSGRRHAGENLDRLLALREEDQGRFIKMADALNANHPTVKTEEMIESNCNSHALRKFVDIEDFFPQAARQVISHYKVVFAHERQAKADRLSDAERLVYHQQHSEAEMRAIKCLAEQQLKDKQVEPKSSLGKAYQYLINHWEKLTEFLRTPGVPLENNRVERALKWMIQVRKNSLFYASEHGAYVGSMLMSLIATCAYAKVNPIDYLTALQHDRRAVIREPEKWLPWNYHLNKSGIVN